MASARAQRFLQHLDQRRRSLKDEVEDDVAALRGLSIEERGKILESVCRDAMAIITARPDSAKALAAQEPRSAESLELWRTLVRRYRADGRD